MSAPARSDGDQSAVITSSPDWLRPALWAGAVGVLTLGAALHSSALGDATRSTIEPFLTLAVVLAGAAIADRLGAFRVLERAVVPDQAPRIVMVASVLAFATLLSALVNLDIAVVVAMPLALRVAQRVGLSGGWIAAAVAVTANASSFLLPTSNITNLLLMGGASLSARDYLADSWLPWLLVTALTVGTLSAWSCRVRAEQVRTVRRGTLVQAMADLLPMFLTASGIRTLLSAGVVFHGPLVAQLAGGSLLAAAVNNLPAAATLHVTGTSSFWVAILAAAIGPNLFITGSVATLICRRIARDGGARFGVLRFTAMGCALLPAQLGVGTLGLHIAGAIR